MSAHWTLVIEPTHAHNVATLSSASVRTYRDDAVVDVVHGAGPAWHHNTLR
jgi:hypothetical protein